MTTQEAEQRAARLTTIACVSEGAQEYWEVVHLGQPQRYDDEAAARAALSALRAASVGELMRTFQ